MKNALILHGTGNDSEGNWFPWLEKELLNRGWQVWVPNLPQAREPNINRYNDYIFSSGWQFNEESVLIGHSSGAVAILGLLQNLPETTKVDSCILVGSFKDSLGVKSLEGLFLEPFEFDKIRERSNKFIFIHSDNDPYCPLDHARFLAEKLNGELIIKPGQGHFNLEVGPEYKKFPLLLELLDQEAESAE